MLIRYYLVATYILSCIKIAPKPWNYFQLNADFYNVAKALFSKQDINDLVPPQWRLLQWQKTPESIPQSYPIFVKPEWGQNSYGVQRIDTAKEWALWHTKHGNSPMPMLIQEAALGTEEIEIFYVRYFDTDHDTNGTDRHSQDTHKQAASKGESGTAYPWVFSVTQVHNKSGESSPVNGIYNPNTYYQDMTAALSQAQLGNIWQHIKDIGPFNIARVGVCTSSLEALLEGDFKVIEVNLFVPMPLSLLCPSLTFWQRLKLARKVTYALARVTKTLSVPQPRKAIFFSQWSLSRQQKY